MNDDGLLIVMKTKTSLGCYETLIRAAAREGDFEAELRKGLHSRKVRSNGVVKVADQSCGPLGIGAVLADMDFAEGFRDDRVRVGRMRCCHDSGVRILEEGRRQDEAGTILPYAPGGRRFLTGWGSSPAGVLCCMMICHRSSRWM